MKNFHGSPIRGLAKHPSSPMFEGVFGRMFRSLPGAVFSRDALKKLAEKMVADAENAPTPEDKTDDEENTGIDAGYTYLGQFLDHDLTFDPSSSLQKQNDPDGLIDFRTPRFDLDNIYGRGPADQPYMYDSDGVHFVLGPQLTGAKKDSGARGLQRNGQDPKRAIIGDPRNDENVIVSQLQAAMLRFHNHIADLLLKKHPTTKFEKIQRTVRWHYQWIVLHDFLPTIVGREIVDAILPHLTSKKSMHQDPPQLKFYSFKNYPFIPVEFSVAAYRFGHSMVRPIYRLNETIDRKTIFSKNPDNSLNGFREFPSNWAIDWDLFFFQGSAEERHKAGAFGEKDPRRVGKGRTQLSYKIDTSLVNPLGDLKGAKEVPDDPSSLALRNLERGASFALPSGQAVARFMGVPVIPDDKLRVGKATEQDSNPDVKTKKINNPLLTELSEEFAGNAPLWYYILAEAQQQFQNDETPIHLGPVGGRIVAEVFIGLLLGDPHSFLSQNPDWSPLEELGGRPFRMKDLLNSIR